DHRPRAHARSQGPHRRQRERDELPMNLVAADVSSAHTKRSHSRLTPAATSRRLFMVPMHAKKRARASHEPRAPRGALTSPLGGLLNRTDRNSRTQSTNTAAADSEK